MKMIRPLVSILATALVVSAQAAPQGDCFRLSDNRHLPFEVFQVSGPAKYSVETHDYQRSSPSYPATDYTTTTVRLINKPSPQSASGLHFRKYFFLWANRCIYLPGITPDPQSCRNTKRPKGNGYYQIVTDARGQQVRPAFSTYAKANACTLIQARRVLGESAEQLRASADDVGVRLWTDPDRTKLLGIARRVEVSSGREMSYLVDLCILENEPQASDSTGIVLDYEVWDNRTPQEALAFIRQLAALVRVKGKTFIVNTNALPRAPNGLDSSNVREVIASVDAFIPTITSGATPGNPTVEIKARTRTQSPLDNYKSQVSLLSDHGQRPLSAEERRKILWNISLYDMHLNEARALHDDIKNQGFGGIMIFRNYVKQGGSCSRPENQVIACLTMGQCSGNFGMDR